MCRTDCNTPITAAELEREVHARRAAGASPKEIARALGVRPADVIPIVRRVAGDRAVAARIAAGLYQLKVTLEAVTPPIWRRLLVPGRISLGDLHLVLQTVMGWENEHLYEFQVGKRMIGGYPPGVLAPDSMFRRQPREDADTVELATVAPKKGARLTYVYDFGDNWEHEVLVEATSSPDGDPSRAVCLAGERACPPEDCGGVWGYEELLAAIADPRNPALAERREWIDQAFDPGRFDIHLVNARLRGFELDVVRAAR